MSRRPKRNLGGGRRAFHTLGTQLKTCAHSWQLTVFTPLSTRWRQWWGQQQRYWSKDIFNITTVHTNDVNTSTSITNPDDTGLRSLIGLNWYIRPQGVQNGEYNVSKHISHTSTALHVQNLSWRLAHLPGTSNSLDLISQIVKSSSFIVIV